jgi:signal transduction histidine kinase
MSGWPVFLAMGLVALLIAGILGLDMLFSQLVGRDTEDILENSLRSTVLLQDLRTHLTRAFAPDLQAREIGTLAGAIAADSQAYEARATHPGEREEWDRLQALLQTLTVRLPDPPQSRSLLGPEIYGSINRLVSINLKLSRRNAAAIRTANREAFVSDAIVGGATLILVILIGTWLLRVLGRQRRLVAEHVDHLNQKNAELEAFAGRAAHDLRSPMSPIRGYAELIMEAKGESAEVVAMAQRIRRAVDRMAMVVDDMLALSTAGSPPHGQSSTDAVVAALLEELEPELRGVDVVTRLSAGRVACPEGILMQILRNLVGNALKFRARSRPLQIKLESRDVDEMVEIAIEDNGVGMDAESVKHAFEPFFRGQLDLEVPGHGLGLAIVDRTTRALGGTREVSSVLNQGTRIVVRLPRIPGDQSDAADARTKSAGR